MSLLNSTYLESLWRYAVVPLSLPAVADSIKQQQQQQQQSSSHYSSQQQQLQSYFSYFAGDNSYLRHLWDSQIAPLTNSLSLHSHEEQFHEMQQRNRLFYDMVNMLDDGRAKTFLFESELYLHHLLVRVMEGGETAARSIYQNILLLGNVAYVHIPGRPSPMFCD